MNFDEYQKLALTTAYTDPAHKDTLMEKTIWAMGVAGEAGEVVEKWKKIVAYKNGEMSEEDRSLLGKELADVVWYIAVMAHSLGFSFDELMEENIKKLQDRKERGVIKGEGDTR